MATSLSRQLDEFAAEVTGIAPARAAAEAMGEVMRKGIASNIGGDLRMSNFKGSPIDLVMTASVGRATVKLGGGTYALADKGRTPRRRKIRARRGRALNTPWGPRRSVKASRWAGFGITDRYAPEALQAGVDAAMAVIRKGV